MPPAETQTLGRAVAILDCFSSDQPELGVREIARRVGLASSTVGRLLATMHTAGILSQNPTSRTYALGAKVLAWAGVYTATLDVRSKARTVLEEVHRATRETVSLYLLDGGERICVERIEGSERIRAVVRIGERMPLHAGASGKILLASLPAARRKEILSSTLPKRLTPHTITNRAILERELATIRSQGYAVSLGERVPEAASVATPIHDADGNVIAALNISGPVSRFTKVAVSAYVRKAVRAAARISRQMGYLADRRETKPPA